MLKYCLLYDEIENREAAQLSAAVDLSEALGMDLSKRVTIHLFTISQRGVIYLA